MRQLSVTPYFYPLSATCIEQYLSLGIARITEGLYFCITIRKDKTMSKRLTFWAAALFTILYFTVVFASAFIGFISPACWIFFPSLAALVAAFPYRWLALRWKHFGLGTVLATMVAVLCLVMGEMDILQAGVVIGFGLLSDLVAFSGKDWLSYPVLAIGNTAWIMKLWTETDWYYNGAINEMGQEYADGLLPFATPCWCCIAIAATIIMAEIGLWAARKTIK